MKKIFVAAALVAGSLVSLSAHAVVLGFTGLFAPNQWTTTITGNLTGASGGSASINTTTLVLTGGNAISPDPGNFVPACLGAQFGLPGPCQISFTTTNILNNFVFDWSYSSADSSGAAADLFGMLINGTRISLSDPGGAPTQSGHVLVAAGSLFGWYINCTDCIEGAAQATITNFQAGVVPEPGTIALLGLGVIGLMAARRERVARGSQRTLV
jgi:PEP-CTERM motif